MAPPGRLIDRPVGPDASRRALVRTRARARRTPAARGTGHSGCPIRPTWRAIPRTVAPIRRGQVGRRKTIDPALVSPINRPSQHQTARTGYAIAILHEAIAYRSAAPVSSTGFAKVAEGRASATSSGGTGRPLLGAGPTARVIPNLLPSVPPRRAGRRPPPLLRDPLRCNTSSVNHLSLSLIMELT